MDFPKIREKLLFWSSARCRRSCAMKLSEIGDEIWQKHKNLKIFQKSSIFSKKYPMTFFEIKNFQKSDPFFQSKKKVTFLKIIDFEKCHRTFFRKNRTFFEKFQFFIFLSYFIPNLWKFHCATPSTPRARPKKSFFLSNFGKISGFSLPTFCQCSRELSNCKLRLN